LIRDRRGTLGYKIRAGHLAALAIATILLSASTASAATRHVSASGGDTANDCLSAASPCASVGHAVTEAVDGDTVSVAAGAYTGSGQVTIDKDLTINGAGAEETVLVPGYDVPFGESWFRVTDGHDFEVSDLAFDGTGYDVFWGIRFHGSASGAIDSVGFDTIRHSRYLGIAVTTNKGGPPEPASVDLDVTNSSFEEIERVGVLYKGADVTGTFSGNTYEGKGDGDFLDYALDISAGADIDVSGNTVTGNRGVASVDGSSSAGFLVSTFWGPGTEAGFIGNTVEGNTTGIHVGFDALDASTVSASGNRIVGNGDGVVTTTADIDAQNNWWGCNAGPGGAGCDSVDSRNGGAIARDPRIVLGAGVNPASIEAGGQSAQITAEVSRNSAGQSVAAGALDGVSVDFATDLGAVSPASEPLVGGTAASTLTSGAAAGTANVSATLDNQTVGAPLAITEPPPPLPDPDPGTGSDGDDLIDGTDGDDVIDGLGGDDELFGELGNDLIDGGEGDDLLDGGVGDDAVVGGEGDDDVKGGQGGDEVKGGRGDDDVAGGQGNDDVKGGQGDDSISGGPGNDDIGGGSGEDTIDSHDGDRDTVRCGPDEDQLNADGRDEYGPNCEAVS
jgi:hypothetical protein